MDLIVITGPGGQRRLVLEDEVFRLLPGEQVTGSVQGLIETSAVQELENAGVQWGFAIAWATKQLGMSKCPACKAREYVLNHVKQFGLKGTISAIIKTIREPDNKASSIKEG